MFFHPKMDVHIITVFLKRETQKTDHTGALKFTSFCSFSACNFFSCTSWCFFASSMCFFASSICFRFLSLSFLSSSLCLFLAAVSASLFFCSFFFFCWLWDKSVSLHELMEHTVISVCFFYSKNHLALVVSSQPQNPESIFPRASFCSISEGNLTIRYGIMDLLSISLLKYNYAFAVFLPRKLQPK